jgi:hypothetical protein
MLQTVQIIAESSDGMFHESTADCFSAISSTSSYPTKVRHMHLLQLPPFWHTGNAIPVLYEPMFQTLAMQLSTSAYQPSCRILPVPRSPGSIPSQSWIGAFLTLTFTGSACDSCIRAGANILHIGSFGGYIIGAKRLDWRGQQFNWWLIRYTTSP